MHTQIQKIKVWSNGEQALSANDYGWKQRCHLDDGGDGGDAFGNDQPINHPNAARKAPWCFRTNSARLFPLKVQVW